MGHAAVLYDVLYNFFEEASTAEIATLLKSERIQFVSTFQPTPAKSALPEFILISNPGSYQ